MNQHPSGAKAARPGALVIASLLAMLHCNTILGIEEASCIGACADGAATPLAEVSAAPLDEASSQVAEELQQEALPDAGSSSSRGSGLASADAGPSSGVLLVPEAAASGALPTLRVNEVGTPALDLDQIITSACAQQPAGKSLCVVNYRVLCGADGVAASVSVCPDVDRCLGGSGAQCYQPFCAPGERRCSEDRLELCNPEGTEFVELQRCEKKTSCSPDEGCVGDVCTASELRCHDNDLQQCNPARTAFETIQKCGHAGCDQDARRCNE